MLYLMVFLEQSPLRNIFLALCHEQSSLKVFWSMLASQATWEVRRSLILEQLGK